jgi:hypothetical protein
MRIIATGSYFGEVSSEPPPLKTLALEATGVPARRISRFVELALIGAGRCVNGRCLPADTATYVTSVRGDLETTLGALVQVCEHHRSPAPFTFINSVGTSVGFQIAASFALKGRSQFVTRRYAPLEAALRLAALDLADGSVRTALVGSAEMCTAPIGAHRARIDAPPGLPLGEGSHWLLLEGAPTEDASVGRLRDVRFFADESGLVRHLRECRLDTEAVALAGGQHLRPERLDRVREATGFSRVFDYAEGLPWYDSRTGHGVHRFLSAPVARTLVHVDGDPSGRYALLIIDATPPRATASRPEPPGRRSP